MGFAGHTGVEFLAGEGKGHARGRIEVRDHHLQPHGVLHGGVYATLSESVCSHATARAVSGDGMVAIGQSNQTTFLRPITNGHVNADARLRHRGRTTWVWEVELTDDEGRLCALTQMTVAVRQASSQD
jgi:uncharacterized protein (TIGR00369 family)